MNLTKLCICSASVLVLACGGRSGTRTTGTPEPAAKAVPRCGMTLSSPAFADGQAIPTRHTGDGENISPELGWTDVPDSTRSFALICSDPDAPSSTFIHWVIFNIPADTRRLEESIAPGSAALTDGASQGANGAGRLGYTGPKPPPGRPHRYFFRLYALDKTLAPASSTVTAAVLEKEMTGHVLATAELMGTYRR